MISALFMAMVFGGKASIDLWGPHGLAIDFVPQTFMISAMSILVPTLIARRRMRGGAIEPLRPPTLPALLQPLWRRVSLVAVTLTGVAGSIGTGLLAALWADPLTFWKVFPVKLAYWGADCGDSDADRLGHGAFGGSRRRDDEVNSLM